jgi:uncharacterized protein YhjY with autotransporter beta-barrel domain
VQITAELTTSVGSTVTVNVLVLVSNQPDPSKNPDVLGLINAQTEQAQRFAQSQLDNIHGRLESLHDSNGSTALFSNNLSINVDGKSLQGAGAPGGVNGTGASTAGGQGTAMWSTPQRPGIGASESAGGAASASDQPPTTPTNAATPASGPSGLGVWVGGIATFGSFDAYRQAAGFDADTIAVNVGIDQRIGDHALVGFTLGYNHDNSDVANDGTRSVAKGYSAAFYGSFQPAAHTYIDAVLGGGGLSFDSRRYDGDTEQFLLGTRHGDQWFSSLTAGYEYQKGGWLLSPYARAEWSLSSLNGFSENGAATSALTYGDQTVRTMLAVLGLRVSGEMQESWGVLVPRAGLEVGHDFQGTTNTTLSYAFIPSAGSWNVLTNPYAANGTSAQLGLGLDLRLPYRWLLTTDYGYMVQPHAHNQMIRLGINKQF